MIEMSQQGHQLLKTGKYEEARQIFEAALESRPRDASLLLGLADTLRLQKQFSAASGYYRQVLEIDPDATDALRGFGDAMRGQRCYIEAIESWKKYLELKDRGDVFVLTRIADCYKTLNDYDNSHAYYQYALASNAHNRFALIGLADLYHKKGLEPEAIEYYEKALENGVTLINILTIVGNLHYRQGNYEKARIYYEKTLAQDPKNAYALFGLGNYYRWKSDYRRAVELWEKIQEKNSGTANMLSRLGDAYRNLGQFSDAERTYQKNLKVGYNKFSLVGLIKLHSLQSHLQETCDYYDTLLQNEAGEERKVFVEVGDLFIKRNERNLAREFFQHVLKRQNDYPVVTRIIEERLKLIEED